MKKRILSSLIITLAAVWLLPASILQAKEWQDSGTGSYVPVSSDSVKLANGNTVVHQTSKGIVLSNDSKSIINLVTQDAGGSSVTDADGNLVEAHGYADGVDRDGDTFWIWWKNSPEGNTWGYVGGTGKFKGIKGGGTTKLLASFPDGRWTISWEGKVMLP